MENAIDLRQEYFSQAIAWGRSLKEDARTEEEIAHCKKMFDEYWAKYMEEKDRQSVIHKIVVHKKCNCCGTDAFGETVKSWNAHADGIQFQCVCENTLHLKKGEYL